MEPMKQGIKKVYRHEVDGPKTTELRNFMEYLDQCGLMTKEPNEIDYELVVWRYLRKQG